MARSRSGWTGGTSSMSGPGRRAALRRPLLGFWGHGFVRRRLDRRQRRRGRRLGADRLVDLALDLLRDLRVLAQVALRVVAPLAEPLLAVGEERAGLLDDV